MSYSNASKQLFKKAYLGVVVLSLFACGGEFNGTSLSASKADSSTSTSTNTTELIAFSDQGPTDGVNLLPNTPEQIAALKEAENTYNTIAATESNVTGFIVHYKSGTNINTATTKSNSAVADVAAKQLAQASLLQYNQIGKGLGLAVQTTSNTLSNGTELRLNKTTTLVQASELSNKLIAADTRIESIEPNVLFQSSSLVQGQSVTDKKYLNQWGLNQFSETFATTGKSYGINPQNAWTKTTGETIADVNTGTPVVVAVLDTGKKDHEDLTGQYLPGYDFVSNAATSNDGNGRDADATDPGDNYAKKYCGKTNNTERKVATWHGTQVASVIAALVNNATSDSNTAGGMVGVAPNAKIVPVRVTGPCGANLTDVADAIRWAAGGTIANVPVNANPAKIINVSLEAPGTTCSPSLSSAIAFANSKGSVVVVPAGNSKKLAGDVANLTMPANCSAAITVGAIKENGAKADYSNSGTFVDVSAPGQNITVASFEANGAPNYVSNSGTSFAAAHVSGVLALMYAAKPELTMGAATNFLKLHVSPIPQVVKPNLKASGTGLVDASMAIDAVTHEPTFVPRNDVAGVGASQIIWKNKLTNKYESSRLYFVTDAQSETITIAEPQSIGVLIDPSDTFMGVGKFLTNNQEIMTKGKSVGSVYTNKVKPLNQAELGDPALDVIQESTAPAPKTYAPLEQGNFYKDANEEFAYRDTSKAVLILRKILATNASTQSSDKAVLEKRIGLSNDLAYIGTADFNSDGYTDTLWRDKITGWVKVLYTAENVTIWQNLYKLKSTSGVKESVLAIGDFVGDSSADIVIRDSVSSIITVVSIGSNGSVTQHVSDYTIDYDKNIDTLKVGDFNGDQKDDFILITNLDVSQPWYISGFTFNATTGMLNLPIEQNPNQYAQFNTDGTLMVSKYKPF